MELSFRLLYNENSYALKQMVAEHVVFQDLFLRKLHDCVKYMWSWNYKNDRNSE